MNVQSFSLALMAVLGGSSLLTSGCGQARDDQSKSGSGVAAQIVPVETAVAGRAP